MKRLFLLFVLSSLISVTFGQKAQQLTPVKFITNDCISESTSAGAAAAIKAARNAKRAAANTGHARAVQLVVDTLGTAGNLYTSIDGEVNSLAYNPDLNTVVFIHRADPTVLPKLNLGQYLYDISYVGGGSWSLNHGPLDPTGNNISLAGRYPNVTIYNPAGNTNPQNAYLGYLGAWLPYNNGTNTGKWSGFLSGVCKLNNDTTTVTETVNRPNNGNSLIAHGLCNGLPGQFWAADLASTTGLAGNGILLYKGVWNNTTNDIAWSVNQNITPSFNPVDKSPIRDVNVAFDHTGRYGWLVAISDISRDTRFAYRPIAYKTTDGGNTWTGPLDVILDSMPNVVANISPVADRPNCLGNMDLGVDFKGNPHIAITVLPGHGDSLFLSHMNVYDFTLNEKGEWMGLKLDSVQTFQGTFGSVVDDNRPQVASTTDDNFITFGWLNSDPAVSGDIRSNTTPNLMTRAYNVTTGLSDLPQNITGQDDVWQNQTQFETFATTSKVTGDVIEVPTTFALLNGSGSSEDPASFYYMHGVQNHKSQMTHDITPPVIFLKGGNTISILQNSPYVEPGDSAHDNVDGDITANVTTNAVAAVNVNTVGTYYVTYSVSDAAGNKYSTRRKVLVIANPNTTPAVITLNGPDTITINKCVFFSDPGAKAISAVEGDISDKITSNVGTIPFGGAGTPGTPGTYNLTYSVTDFSGNTSSVTRTIIIKSTAPQITLSGNDTISIQPCAFVTSDVSAYDQCLGPVPVTISTFDQVHPGTYQVTYTATNGNETTVLNRQVTILADTIKPTATLSGANPYYVYLGTSYNDTLPSASDCSGIQSITSDASTQVQTTSHDTTTVTYTVTDSAGNAKTLTRVVIVNTEPEPDFKFGYSANGVVFTDLSKYNPNSWVWDFGDNIGSTKQNPLHKYTKTGLDTVCLSSKNQFNSAPFSKPARKTCKVVAFTVGIDDVVTEDAFNIYPNPTTGTVTLDVNAAGFDKMDIAIYNMIGENVSNMVINQVPAQSKYELNLANFSNGVYLIRIQTEKGSVTKKVTLFSGK